MIQNAKTTGFAANLRSIRARLGLTCAEVSKRTGVDASLIGRMERGTKEPRNYHLTALAYGLGVTVEELTTPSAALAAA